MDWNVIDKEFLQILACPVCKRDLTSKGKLLICQNCQVYYEIKEGIPILLPDSGKPLEKENH